MTDSAHVVDRLDILVTFKADLDAAQETLSRCHRLPLAMVPDQIEEAIWALWRVVDEITDLEAYYDARLMLSHDTDAKCWSIGPVGGVCRLKNGHDGQHADGMFSWCGDRTPSHE